MSAHAAPAQVSWRRCCVARGRCLSPAPLPRGRPAGGCYAPLVETSRRHQTAAAAVPEIVAGGSQIEVVVPAGRLEVRALTEQDVTGAAVVMTRAFAGKAEDITMEGAMKYARDVLLKTPAAVLLVARLFPTDASLLPPGQSSRLVATVGLALQPVAVQKFNTLQPPLGAAYLSNLAVDKKLQRQGIGRAMVAVCEDVAAAAGAPAVCLHVNADDPPVQRLYQAAGYTELGRDNPLVCRLQGVTRPRILMRKQTAAAAAGAM